MKKLMLGSMVLGSLVLGACSNGIEDVTRTVNYAIYENCEVVTLEPCSWLCARSIKNRNHVLYRSLEKAAESVDNLYNSIFINDNYIVNYNFFTESFEISNSPRMRYIQPVIELSDDQGQVDASWDDTAVQMIRFGSGIVELNNMIIGHDLSINSFGTYYTAVYLLNGILEANGLVDVDPEFEEMWSETMFKLNSIRYQFPREIESEMFADFIDPERDILECY